MLKTKIKKKIDADTWLRKNLEYVVKNFAGGYVVIVNTKGIIYTDADGTPKEIIAKAKAKYKREKPLFFRVPHQQDFICALIVP